MGFVGSASPKTPHPAAKLAGKIGTHLKLNREESNDLKGHSTYALNNPHIMAIFTSFEKPSPANKANNQRKFCPMMATILVSRSTLPVRRNEMKTMQHNVMKMLPMQRNVMKTMQRNVMKTSSGT